MSEKNKPASDRQAINRPSMKLRPMNWAFSSCSPIYRATLFSLAIHRGAEATGDKTAVYEVAPNELGFSVVLPNLSGDAL